MSEFKIDNEFNEEKWEKNEWIESHLVQKHFHMEFSECMNKFGFCKVETWDKLSLPIPIMEQRIVRFFRKNKEE